MKSLCLMMLVASTLACSGCATLHDFAYKRVRVRNAKRAWETCGPTQLGDGTWHYRRGWIRGHSDVASGSNGAPPAIPPKRYWRCANQAAGEIWYEGYREGARVAKCSGVEFCNELPNSGASALCNVTVTHDGCDYYAYGSSCDPCATDSFGDFEALPEVLPSTTKDATDVSDEAEDQAPERPGAVLDPAAVNRTLDDPFEVDDRMPSPDRSSSNQQTIEHIATVVQEVPSADAAKTHPPTIVRTSNQVPANDTPSSDDLPSETSANLRELVVVTFDEEVEPVAPPIKREPQLQEQEAPEQSDAALFQALFQRSD